MSDESDQGNDDDAMASVTQNASIDPYAVLNIAPNAKVDEIQKAYKTLSRSFHPDKQPPGKNRDVAQQYFVQFKFSYDVLIDPVLRLSYDCHGMEGVRFILKSVKIYKEVEQLLAQIDEGNQKATNDTIRRAKDVLSEAIQFHNFYTSTQFHKPSTSAGISVNCDSTHSTFLGEGIDGNVLEVEKTRINLSVSKSPNAKTNISFSGHAAVGNGEGSSGTQLSINCEPLQGTDVNLDFNVGATPEQTKLTFGTSRLLSNRTYVATSISAFGSEEMPAGLSLTSQRSIMENKITGVWMVGLGLPNFQLQYGLLSFTSNFPNQPKITAKFNVGMDYTPIRIIAEKNFDEENKHSGKLSWGWGPNGIDLKGMTSRCLTKYCKITIGLHHVSSKGLTWLFKLQRGTVEFSVPVLITTVMSPAYAVKSMYMTLFLGMVDASLGDFVRKEVNEAIVKTSTSENRALRKEEILLEREKIKRDALQQIDLMEKPADLKRKKEEENGGLVILHATYEVLGGDFINVTTALMFWVVKGRLQLPSTTKSSMLGFYDVRHEVPLAIENGYFNACWKVWEKLRHGEREESNILVEIPILKIRYRYEGNVYEVTIKDDEPLSLPSPKAMLLGGTGVN